MSERTGPAHVVMLHGLWMTGVEATFLRRRLRERYGFNTHQMHYRTVRSSLSENAEMLREFISAELAGRDDTTCHLIGHSLGGLVIMKMLCDWAEAPPGRVVCLGTPLCGSTAAERIAKLPGGHSILGKSIAEGVLAQSAAQWAEELAGREVGVIAGTLSVGMGRLLGKLPQPNDGTVTVEETRWPQATDHLQIGATHTSLVASREVTDQVAHFLNHGSFLHTNG